MKTVQPGRRRLSLPAAALAILSFAGAALVYSNGASSSVDDRPPSTTTSSRPAVTVAAAPAKKTADAAKALPAAGAPQRVYIEALSIDVPVLPIATEGSTLTPPSDPQDLGWWSDGAQPGAANGSALVTGHTVRDGGGALDDLETLRPGAEIQVRTAKGVIDYVTTTVDVLDKATIAKRAPELFSQEVAGRLVLITCEDWDGTGWRSNVVVTAVPAT